MNIKDRDIFSLLFYLAGSCFGVYLVVFFTFYGDLEYLSIEWVSVNFRKYDRVNPVLIYFQPKKRKFCNTWVMNGDCWSHCCCFHFQSTVCWSSSTKSKNLINRHWTGGKRELSIRYTRSRSRTRQATGLVIWEESSRNLTICKRLAWIFCGWIRFIRQGTSQSSVSF